MNSIVVVILDFILNNNFEVFHLHFTLYLSIDIDLTVRHANLHIESTRKVRNTYMNFYLFVYIYVCISYLIRKKEKEEAPG